MAILGGATIEALIKTRVFAVLGLLEGIITKLKVAGISVFCWPAQSFISNMGICRTSPL